MVSLQVVVEVKSACGALMFVCLIPPAAELDIDACLHAAPPVVGSASAAVAVVAHLVDAVA